MTMTSSVRAIACTLALLFMPSLGAAACDIAECNPQTCDSWRPTWTINDFPAHQTDTTVEQRSQIGEIARRIADSHSDAQPIICLRLVGHASSFRNISANEYDRRAETRGETIAEMLAASLETHGLTSFTVHRDEIDNDDAFCGEVLGSDVTLIFDGKGNSCPLVDNMVNSSNATARANRAINRRVSIYAIDDSLPIETVDTSPQEVCESFPNLLCANVPDFMIEGRVCAGSFAGDLAGLTREELKARIEAGTATHLCGPLD
ncbi:hypothetical protein SAMN05421759_1182 [Roseivivax lentus]|uniref:Uncharacterized protein n=1 Tax=Roseivivax lentus TaxID=633194 RepID=A0A1N7PNQ5_9RHOB|nr:hypothetical protein [Roseivivax lentus]SIT12211.1 hypothetical protein SAMN05421759_1182 [Roseivivax lentus]